MEIPSEKHITVFQKTENDINRIWCKFKGGKLPDIAAVKVGKPEVILKLHVPEINLKHHMHENHMILVWTDQAAENVVKEHVPEIHLKHHMHENHVII